MREKTKTQIKKSQAVEEDDGEGFFAAAASNPALRGTAEQAGGGSNGEGGEKAVSGALFAFILGVCVCGWSQVCIIGPAQPANPTDHTNQPHTGLESIFQLVHLIMTDFRWEADALVRAKKLYAQGHDMTVNSLEGASWI